MPCDSIATIKTILAKVGLDGYLKDAKSFAPLKAYLEKEGFSNVSLTIAGPSYQVISLSSSTISFYSFSNKVSIKSLSMAENEKIEQSISKLQGFLAQHKAFMAIKKKFEVTSIQEANTTIVLTVKL